MGNCCRKLKDIIYPNPWDGFVVESLGYNYRTYSVSIDDVYGYKKPLATVTPTASPTLAPLQPSLTVYEDRPVPQERDHRVTAPVLSRPPSPSDPLLKAVIVSPRSTPILPKTPIKNKDTQLPPSLSSSPLHLGSAAVAPPPPLSLLAITKQKKLAIEY
jgi:hypothetical protein